MSLASKAGEAAPEGVVIDAPATAALASSSTMAAPPTATRTAGAPTAAALDPAPPQPASIPTLSYVAYFTASQLETLYARKRASQMSTSKWQANRTLATGFIQTTACRLGFPQRTTATAQLIYQRFHLFYPPAEFVLHELAVASLFVAAKLNDTPKKAREILLASYALRFPQLVKGAGPLSSADAAPLSVPVSGDMLDDYTFPTLAGQKRKHAAASGTESQIQQPSSSVAAAASQPFQQAAIGSVSETDVDPTILETDRKRLLALEKLLLESLCFNFHLRPNETFKMVIKLGRLHNLPKSFIRTAWRLAADMHRTTAPLQYPPAVIALASLYLTALLARPLPRPLPTPAQVQAQAQAQHPSNGQQDTHDSRKPKSESPERASDRIRAFVEPLACTAPPGHADCAPLEQFEASSHVYIEDVEEAIHELLDLYISVASALPPSVYMNSSGGGGGGGQGVNGTGFSTSLGGGLGTATPSPHSPADHRDLLTASPSSSTTGFNEQSLQAGNNRRKLRQYEYAAPPFGVVDWLNCARCSQLDHQPANATGGKRKGTTTTTSVVATVGAVAAAGASGSQDPTAPIKEFNTLLTDLKIYLRGIEYERSKADDALLSSLQMVAEIDVQETPSSNTLPEELNPSSAIGIPGSITASSLTVRIIPIPTSTPTPTQSGVKSSSSAPNLSSPQVHDQIARIRRRKLVSALRITFVEPNVELQPSSTGSEDVKLPAAPTAKESNGSHSLHQHAADSKKQRIDHATRYLF
ncbi:cyclin-like protein [Testicularia cyperi]|uniref:Cyclin-like protein n=1 Tax=Testicularia cyperi TaxID=1882483 RepID=A0A317XJR5_9BASI|nr:cyclin-like protein [Testicularia cyperi]